MCKQPTRDEPPAVPSPTATQGAPVGLPYSERHHKQEVGGTLHHSVLIPVHCQLLNGTGRCGVQAAGRRRSTSETTSNPRSQRMFPASDIYFHHIN